MLHLHTTVVDIEDSFALLQNGEKILARTTIFVSGIEPSSPEIIPVPKIGDRGRIVVNKFLHLPEDNRVFVAGDVSGITDPKGKLVPQTAQAAVQEARSVAGNIISAIQEKSLSPFAFRELGQTLSLGRFSAGARIGGITFSGFFAWWLWRTIYASKIIGFANRVRVVVDWTIGLFHSRSISEE